MKQGWEIKKLGEVVTFQRGLTYSKEDEVEFSCNGVLRSNNIDLNTMSLVFDELKYVREDLVIAPDKKLSKGGILICMSNGSKQHLGKVAFIDKDYDYAFGGFMGLIKPNDDICAKYVYYTCISSSYKHFLAGVGCGANITNLKFADLAQHTIPVPSIAEQERIVGELDCLSGIIAAKRAQLRELDTLAQSIFYTMFGDPITNDKGWQTKIVGEICIHKKHIQRANKVFLPTSKIKYIDISSIDNTTNHIVLADEIIFSDAPSRAQQKVKYGDILISLVRPNLKNIAVLNYSYDNLVASSGFCILRTESTVVNKYYMLYVILYNSFTKYLMDRTSGANYPAVREDDIKQCKISVPPIDLQNEFAEKIESIERQKKLITKSIKETEDLFNSRMSYYFN